MFVTSTYAATRFFHATDFDLKIRCGAKLSDDNLVFYDKPPSNGLTLCPRCAYAIARVEEHRERAEDFENTLVQFMRMGLSEPAIAQRLGVGLRTLTRAKAALIARHRARNVYDLLYILGSAGAAGRGRKPRGEVARRVRAV